MTTLTDDKLREMWRGVILGDHYAHYNATSHALRLAAATRDAAFREAAEMCEVVANQYAHTATRLGEIKAGELTIQLHEQASAAVEAAANAILALIPQEKVEK